MTSATTPSGSTITNDGLSLHYLEQGAGSVDVVVIPGITSPAATWAFIAEAIAEAADVRVITMDVRGRGLSDRAPSGGYRLIDYAADVAALVDQLALERPVILGHSMGARVAAAAGALHSEKCGALIVVDPPLTGPNRPPYPYPLAPYVDALRNAQSGATPDDMRAQFPTWTEDQLRLRAEWLATCDEVALVESYENFHQEDFFEYWAALRPPVLFLYGHDSPVVAVDALDEVRATNAAAVISGVPNAGHMIPWDNLTGFASEISDFLAR